MQSANSTLMNQPAKIHKSYAYLCLLSLLIPLTQIFSFTFLTIATTFVCFCYYAVEFCRTNNDHLINPANAVSYARLLILLTLPFIAEPHNGYLIAALFAVHLSLDGLDGWLARRLECTSEWGARLDMEVDAIGLMIICSLLVSVHQWPGWALLPGTLRPLYASLRGQEATTKNQPLMPPEPRRTWGRYIYVAMCIASLIALVYPATLMNLFLYGSASAVLLLSFIKDGLLRYLRIRMSW